MKTVFNYSGGFNATCEVLHREVAYGRVNVNLNFSVNKRFVEEALTNNTGILYSRFTGKEVGAQIKGQ